MNYVGGATFTLKRLPYKIIIDQDPTFEFNLEGKSETGVYSDVSYASVSGTNGINMATFNENALSNIQDVTA